VIVTHTHHDHWDDAAISRVPKHLPLFAQHDADAELIRSQGFTGVSILSKDTVFNGISLVKTPGQHGTDEAYAVARQIMGEVCGIVFRHMDEKTLYVAGDTIWNDYVRSSLVQHKPDVVVLNAGDAQVPGLGSIIMGREDVRKVHDAAPLATLITSHMEAVNHCVLSRAELRDFADKNGMSQRLLVPEDDEYYTL
jgi:L-ascorbate metabolism protein UlaG (beta-lactamase superfamily)